MIGFFMQGGYMMWLLLIISITIIVLTIKNTVHISQLSGTELSKVGPQIHAILFWGCISVVLGFFAHYQGIYLAMQEIMAASEISPSVVAMGYQAALTTILAGMLVCVIAGILWLALRTWWQHKIVASS